MMSSSQITALIVDDEKMGRDALKVLLRNYLPEVQLVGMANSVQQAVSLIGELNPELVFLDVEMPEEDGFALFRYYPQPPFKVIFVTAYDKYAIRALRLSALDYLLKPVDLEELEGAVARAMDLETPSQNHPLLEQAINLVQQAELERIAIPSSNGFDLLSLDTVVRMESDSNYTYIYSLGKARRLVSKPIGHFEELLPALRFFRVHASHLVHLKYIQRYVKGRGGHLEMGDGSIVPVSARKKADFLRVMGMR